jgi:hypothetical protein
MMIGANPVAEELNPEEVKHLSDVHLPEGCAALWARHFISAWADGRYGEARACLDADSSIHPDTIGDLSDGVVTFVGDVASWGILIVPEEERVLDNGDEVVTFTPAPAGITAPGATISPAVQLIVRHRGDQWNVVRIIRYGC